MVHTKEISYKHEPKCKLDKNGRDKSSKADRWARVNAKLFKPPRLARASYAYRGAPLHAHVSQAAYEQARALARV